MEQKTRTLPARPAVVCRWTAALLAVVAIFAQPRQAAAERAGHPEAPPAQAAAAPFEIPKSIRIEHEKIHVQLVEATKAPGSVGEAARALAEVLHPHFVREEQIALPPLALLEPLAAGKYQQRMKEILPLTDALREELSRMLKEHQSIAALTKKLESTANKAGNAKVEKLAKDLQLHARTEEEVFYPAALLVGDLVRARAPR